MSIRATRSRCVTTTTTVEVRDEMTFEIESTKGMSFDHALDPAVFNPDLSSLADSLPDQDISPEPVVPEQGTVDHGMSHIIMWSD